jgi:hypothetical protein
MNTLRYRRKSVPKVFGYSCHCLKKTSQSYQSPKTSGHPAFREKLVFFSQSSGHSSNKRHFVSEISEEIHLLNHYNKTEQREKHFKETRVIVENDEKLFSLSFQRNQ